MDEAFEFKIPFSMCIVSRRNCGKTHIMQYFTDNLLQNKLIDYCILYSETAHLSGDFSKILDKRYILSNFNESSIDKVIKFQEKQKKQKKPKQCLIIIDDSISCVGHMFQNLINKLFSKGRHWNISIVLINQYIKHAISPIVRSNIDYLLYSVNSISILTYIYDLVIYDGNIKQFITWSQNNTKNFQFIMYKNIHGGEFFFVKAPEILDLHKFKNIKTIN